MLWVERLGKIADTWCVEGSLDEAGETNSAVKGCNLQSKKISTLLLSLCRRKSIITGIIGSAY